MDLEDERSNTSMHEIFEHLGSSVSRYHPMTYSATPNIVPASNAPFAQNLYYENQYGNMELKNALPFMFPNSHRDTMLPQMMTNMNDGNFILYGDHANELNVPNTSFTNKTNGNLMEFNEYEPRSHSSDYNLFSNGDNSTFTNQATPHLLENLVGNWVSDHQNGTYSQFGTSIGMRRPDILESSGINQQIRKPRIVAEVKPMRPSYSDVLAKSVSNQNTKPKNIKTAEVKPVRNLKSSVARSLSGNSNWTNKNLTDANGSNSSLKINGSKKGHVIEPVPKKWASLDDLKNAVENDFIKKKEDKYASTEENKKGKDGWEATHLNGSKTKSNTKSKGSNLNVKTTLINVKGKEKEVTVKPDAGRGKNDDRKNFIQTTDQSSSSSGANDSKQSSFSINGSHNVSKTNQRRNSRALASDRANGSRKDKRAKKRDTWSCWKNILQQRFDLACSYILAALHWLFTLVVDVFALTGHLIISTSTSVWSSSCTSVCEFFTELVIRVKNLSFIKRIAESRFWPFRRHFEADNLSDSDDESDSGDGKVKKRKRLPGGLKHNLPLPSTGDEAMKRLLSCKGKDPYSILGVSQDCTDDDIKKYYKRQAFLVHPDKNNQPGAEEAFKILVHAFDIIGEPEHRKSYDRSVEKTAQVEQAWTELSDLLMQLHKKMEFVANTIRCTNCGKRHKRTSLKRPIYAARMCAQCKIHHSVREGDIWAETTMFGLLWRYYACMEGGVYDITEWAGCQGDNLKNLKANTHNIQYRIVLGKHAQKSNNNNNINNGNVRSQQGTASATTANDPDLEEFINNLCSKHEGGPSDPEEGSANTRKRKNKRKK